MKTARKTPPAGAAAATTAAPDQPAACPLGRCPAERTLDVIGGRWKVPILWHLLQGTLRFSELRRALPGVTQKMLTQQLRELERDGVVDRTVHAAAPPKVEYSLSEYGETLKPLLLGMCEWGKKHRARNTRNAQAANPATPATV